MNKITKLAINIASFMFLAWVFFNLIFIILGIYLTIP